MQVSCQYVAVCCEASLPRFRWQILQPDSHYTSFNNKSFGRITQGRQGKLGCSNLQNVFSAMDMNAKMLFGTAAESSMFQFKFTKESISSPQKVNYRSKNCQRHKSFKALSTLTHSTPLAQNRCLKNFEILVKLKPGFVWQMARNTQNNFDKST